MYGPLIFKSLILILIIAILISLSGGLFFLTRDKGRKYRAVFSLTVRVALSVSLFLVLIIGFLTGQLRPHSALPLHPEIFDYNSNTR
jgi:hypothetical protein